MTWTTLPPALIMLLGACLLPFIHHIHQNTARLAALLIPLIAGWQVYNVANQLVPSIHVNIASFDLTLLHHHDYSTIFGTIFCIATFSAILFGLWQAKFSEIIAGIIYAASALGVVYAGDFISLFLFWELMAIGSATVLLLSDKPHAYGSAMRYIYMHLFGGVLLMTGVIGYILVNGQATIDVLTFDSGLLWSPTQWNSQTIVPIIILIAILVNSATPPFSAWLADSYPKASPFGAIFLSAFTTKTAVFVLLTLYPGQSILIVLGLVMVFYGIIWAILENNMRRILSYSVINQVGFMITGIGIGTPLALAGVATHAFCHIIYKALLFMSAGSVLYMTGKDKCHELGGLYRTMRITTICGIIGALAISAFPFTSGFVSKSLISSAAYDQQLAIVWFLLAAASAGVFLHAGIKFPWFVFFQKDSGLRPKDPPFNMRLAMIFLSALCILPALPAITGPTLYALLPNSVEYHAYSLGHVVEQLQLLLFSGLAFFILLPMLKRTDTITLDFDWFYRALNQAFKRVSRFLFRKVYLPYRRKIGPRRAKLRHVFIYMHGPDGILVSHWPIGLTMAWTVALLAVYLLLQYWS